MPSSKRLAIPAGTVSESDWSTFLDLIADDCRAVKYPNDDLSAGARDLWDSMIRALAVRRVLIRPHLTKLATVCRLQTVVDRCEGGAVLGSHPELRLALAQFDKLLATPVPEEAKPQPKPKPAPTDEVAARRQLHREAGG